jgi:hypothetical protein
MKFRLQKSAGSNRTATKFDVVDDDGAICGRISVPPEEARDLEKHWLQPKASALATSARSKENAMVAAMLAAGQRSAPAPAAAGGKPQNPAVSAMLRAARQNRLTKQAVLRGC